MSGPWDLPNPGKAKSPVSVADKKAINTPPIVGTGTIITKNVFDPERGADLTREAEANSNSQAFQRIRGMVLLGTAIVGNNRFAILRDGMSPGAAAASGRSLAPIRIKLGDSVEGFRLSEISEKRVVFAKGAATVELPLDYFRKTDSIDTRQSGAAQTSSAGQAPAPRVVPPRAVAQPNVPAERVPRAIPTLPPARAPDS